MSQCVSHPINSSFLGLSTATRLCCRWLQSFLQSFWHSASGKSRSRASTTRGRYQLSSTLQALFWYLWLLQLWLWETSSMWVGLPIVCVFQQPLPWCWASYSYQRWVGNIFDLLVQGHWKPDCEGMGCHNLGGQGAWPPVLRLLLVASWPIQNQLNAKTATDNYYVGTAWENVTLRFCSKLKGSKFKHSKTCLLFLSDLFCHLIARYLFWTPGDRTIPGSSWTEDNWSRWDRGGQNSHRPSE